MHRYVSKLGTNAAAHVCWLTLVGLIACDRVPEAPGYERVRVWQLPDALRAVDISRDGQAILLGAERGESSLWTAPWKLSVPFDRVDEPLLTASFTSDGHLVFARAEGALEVRADNGALILDPRLSLSRPGERALFSPDGRYLAFDTTIYDLESMRPVAHAELASSSALAFAGDRSALIAGPGLSVLGLDGAPPRQLPLREPAGAVAASRDAAWFATGGADGVSIWRSDSAEPSCRQDTSAPVQALQFSPSASWLAAISGSRLLLWDVASCQRKASVRLLDLASVLDAGEDLVAVGDRGGNVYVWDGSGGRMLGRGHEFARAVEQLRLHAASRSVLAAARNGAGSEAKLLRLR